jgi:predicted DNA-binding protein (MmcQ/YjbR family)
MNIEEIRETCLAKPAVTEGFPFGEDVLVFKVILILFYIVIESIQ